MPIPTFTLDQLLVLDAIARTGSFASAARELHRVPSAVSYSVKTLEDCLGVDLFDRTGRTAVLNSAGRSLLTEAREIIDSATRLQRLSAQMRGGWEAELHVVMDGIFPMTAVTRVLRKFAPEDIPTRIRLDVEHQEGVPERFFSDRADIMLITDFEDDTGSLDRTPLPNLGMVLVVSCDHVLAGQKRLSRADLSQYLDLVVKDSSSKWAAMPRPAYLHSTQVVHLSDFNTKKAALLEGAGFGWVPTHLVRDELADGRLVLVDLVDGNDWTYKTWLVTRRDDASGRASALFCDAVQAALHQII